MELVDKRINLKTVLKRTIKKVCYDEICLQDVLRKKHILNTWSLVKVDKTTLDTFRNHCSWIILEIN